MLEKEIKIEEPHLKLGIHNLLAYMLLWVAGTDTGFISQNVYLYCAANKMNTVVVGLVDREELHSLMDLNDNEKIIYTQIIGKAKENK